MNKDSAFLKKLLATFKVEAAEHIASISSGLIELEKTLSAEQQAAVIETVFREAHSMKGAARSVNLAGIENVCQAFESVLAALKRKELAPTRELLDLLHRAVNTLGGLLSTAEAGAAPSESREIRELLRELHSAAGGSSYAEKAGELRELPAGPSSPQTTAVPPLSLDTMRISKSRLDSLLLQGESFLTVKQAAAQQTAEIREITAVAAGLRKSLAALRPDLRAAQAAGGGKDAAASAAGAPSKKLLDFLESEGERITRLHHSLVSLGKSLHQGQRSISAMVDGLLDDLKSVSMLPFSSLLEMMPKLVRDLSRDQGKEAVLVTRGGDLEIDKRILDEMKEPLIHLVRNCMDHGIEKPEERVLEKKPLSGTITITVALREGKSVELVVSDDGRGVDTAKVVGSARRLGILSRDEAAGPDERAACALIFRSGVTASPIITDLSGRGLGLAIVRERVERLGGSISCETAEGKGASFRIVLPLTLTTFRGVLVRVDDGMYVIPIANLDRTVRVRRDAIKSIENRETVTLDGRTLPFVPLGAVLELPRGEKGRDLPESIPAAVLGTGEDRIAFGVDEVLNEQEVLVKDLGKQLRRVRNIAAATVLGTGTVVPILNVPDLMKSAVRAAAAAAAPEAARELHAEKKNILVVEDSITTRTLLKNILEALGYDVRTAVDGMDAFTALRTGEFDLVVSDVDMPRMNGFDLTAKIRSDKKLAETPVILVTALESREDRERGIDVGANAYIVKSSFDQGNLLEAIRRLI